MRPRVFVSLGLTLGLLAALPAAAEDFRSFLPPFEGPPSRGPEQFGGNVNTTLIPIQSFVPIASPATYQGAATGYYAATQADVFFWAPLDVPVGVQVTQVCMEVFDNDDAEATAFILFAGESGSATNPAPTAVPLALASTGAVGNAPGFTTICAVPTGGFTFPLHVRTSGNPNGTGADARVQYYLFALAPLTRSANSVMIGAGVVSWQRVVPAGPAVASFSDVPTTHIFYRWIETLAQSGITGGCATGPLRYCPAEPITRGQMAVFIAQALGLYFPN
jgi:hypothetical protein